MEDIETMFLKDVDLVKNQIVQGKQVQSYCLYVSLSDESEEQTHIVTFNTKQPLDSLIGRLEMIKLMIINNLNSLQEPLSEDELSKLDQNPLFDILNPSKQDKGQQDQ